MSSDYTYYTIILATIDNINYGIKEITETKNATPIQTFKVDDENIVMDIDSNGFILFDEVLKNFIERSKNIESQTEPETQPEPEPESREQLLIEPPPSEQQMVKRDKEDDEISLDGGRGSKSRFSKKKTPTKKNKSFKSTYSTK